MIILGPKTAILGPQFCRILVLGPHFWWSGGARAPPGSAPDKSVDLTCMAVKIDWSRSVAASENIENNNHVFNVVSIRIPESAIV